MSFKRKFSRRGGVRGRDELVTVDADAKRLALLEKHVDADKISQVFDEAVPDDRGRGCYAVVLDPTTDYYARALAQGMRDAKTGEPVPLDRVSVIYLSQDDLLRVAGDGLNENVVDSIRECKTGILCIAYEGSAFVRDTQRYGSHPALRAKGPN